MKKTTKPELTKTIKLKIFLSSEKTLQHREVMEQYRLAYNYVYGYICNHNFEFKFYKHRYTSVYLPISKSSISKILLLPMILFSPANLKCTINLFD